MQPYHHKGASRQYFTRFGGLGAGGITGGILALNARDSGGIAGGVGKT